MWIRGSAEHGGVAFGNQEGTATTLHQTSSLRIADGIFTLYNDVLQLKANDVELKREEFSAKVMKIKPVNRRKNKNNPSNILQLSRQIWHSKSGAKSCTANPLFQEKRHYFSDGNGYLSDCSTTIDGQAKCRPVLTTQPCKKHSANRMLGDLFSFYVAVALGLHGHIPATELITPKVLAGDQAPGKISCGDVLELAELKS
jgi:hypothetical protein